jgi:hypothetical protein
MSASSLARPLAARAPFRADVAASERANRSMSVARAGPPSLRIRHSLKVCPVMLIAFSHCGFLFCVRLSPKRRREARDIEA